ncbi:iron-only hydrogenase maturation rSAM protein HydE [Anaerotruncus colihominis DSM 17241]|uniref:Iron-only hydrogenase maturation rSAM protein HydE n=1 Tax=Anaerotruncus colihominis DSM 17241 TaxID=445972 RepID=B0P7Y0_9FIRM|nr:[FeFe] hydrogenase H-cluster radical SAM maturase HydE [Anaerotruncus colihominis]EDS12633.1 iron-only hydrogenase maturation rSAM protein HydE [Anaerotruncus colihominis DSM 17241]
MRGLIDALRRERVLPRAELAGLIREISDGDMPYLFDAARETARSRFGNRIYTRGLIEFTNYCRCDCYYCGIRRSNRQAERYRLTQEEILACCRAGYALGFRTFVLQGGEDPYFTDERICELVRAIKSSWPDCAVTLSIGEKEHSSYRLYRKAGADRYLLRHETASPAHYRRLHPPEQTPQRRRQCLWSLKELGYQVGAGFMVGSPYQTPENLADDLLFLHELSPQMAGIGPFIPHHQTPFSAFPAGTLRQTLLMVALTRLILPNALLPATTALGTIAPDGRERGVLAGANVVMPNLSPVGVRKQYALYDNKICTGDEAAECRACLQNQMRSIGYELAVDRGDFVPE